MQSEQQALKFDEVAELERRVLRERQNMHYLCQLFFLLLTVAGWCAANASPYVPSDGKLVLETLPSRNDPVQQTFSRLRAKLAQDPQSLVVAEKLARLYISASRIDGDPRYLGYAQAVLRPWWNLEHPPIEVLLQRATILQSIHQFPNALADLDLILRTDPDNGQALLTRATVLTVLSDYPRAIASCAQLNGLTHDLVVQACVNNIGSLNGALRKSYETLANALTLYPNLDTSVRVWIMTMVGEMAVRLGESEAAEAYFRKAMMLDTPDGYLLGAYSDFLLNEHRPGEVVGLLKSKTRNDALLLRYALALQAEKTPTVEKSIESLRQRFAAATMRGDTVHQREQARFELHLLGDAKKAVQIAVKNWEVQKEPGDLRILLESAVAANDKKAMGLAVQWISKTHFEDRTMDELLQTAREKA
jgi:tetratricopeptide (TPR) repeat protein